jgi:quaternary ammonium compound-resistance protein SugE
VIKEERNSMAWMILILAGLFETGWAIGLKYTEGFTRFWPTVWTVFAMIVSLWLLGIAMRTLPVGTAYSVWVGVGAVGTVALGIALLEEPANAARLASVGLIIAGIIGLKLATPA